MLYFSKDIISWIIFVTVINIHICNGYHMIDRYSYSVVNNRTKRQATTCKGYEFRCKTGNECINQASQCDGVKDCTDGTDETTACRKIPCQDFAFRCAYGACVDGDAECDNVEQCVDGSDENTARCPKVIVNTACGKGRFTCKSGECIAADKQCDGKRDCADGSDETFTTCSSFPCPDYAYQCSYGACVDGDAKCNDIKECADNSDELPDLCGKPDIVTETPQTTTTSKPINGVKGCILPSPPKDGNYEVSGGVKLDVGAFLPSGSYLLYSCSAGFSLYPTPVSNLNIQQVLCLGNMWLGTLPSCIRTCPPRISSESVNIYCEFNGREVDCDKPQLDGSFAKMKCKNHYENLEIQYRNPLSKCKDGSWDADIIRCVPACGNLIPKSAQLFVVNGKDAAIGDFPWHVGIYRKDKPVITDEMKEIKHICGGSIITTKIVLSAAHCFTDANNGKKFPEANYLVAAGKYFRDYWDPKDENAQKSEVEKLIVPKEYRGIQLSYTYDIALVVVKTPFTVSNLIQPVCFDWGNMFEEKQLTDNSFGMVAGWGLTKEGALIGAGNLKELKVPFIDRDMCEDLAPFDFKGFITPDKICAGWTNGSSVCQGDSGGGLVFLRSDNNRYYIRGLVSNGPRKENTCDSHQIGVYTKVSSHLDWISKNERDFPAA